MMGMPFGTMGTASAQWRERQAAILAQQQQQHHQFALDRRYERALFNHQMRKEHVIRARCYGCGAPKGRVHCDYCGGFKNEPKE